MLAIDLGGTRLKAALVKDRVPGQVLIADHGSSSLEGALACLAEMVQQLAPDGCSSVGMCLPGVVDDTGRVVTLPGKLEGAVGVVLAGWLRDHTGGTAIIVNDAIAYGVGEAYGEPGRTVVMTTGTGVGVAVLENGHPLGNGPLGGGLLSGRLGDAAALVGLAVLAG